MATTTTDKRCPHCNYKLVGTEVFRETCPKCQRRLKETKDQQNTQKIRNHSQKPAPSDSISFGETQIAASVPLSFDDNPKESRPNSRQQTASPSKGPANYFPAPSAAAPMPLGSVPSMVMEPISQPTYKTPFMVSLVINALLLLTVGFLAILLLSSSEEKVNIHKDQQQNGINMIADTNMNEAENNGANSVPQTDEIADGSMTKEGAPASDEELASLALVSPQNNGSKNKKSTVGAGQNPNIVIPPKIEGPTPNPLKEVDQTGSIGKVMISSVPVAQVTINGKKAGYTPGLRATLPNHNGIIIVGDNTTPFNLRFIFQEEDGKLSYQVSSFPDCLVLFNGIALGRTPQEAKSKGGIDSFNFEIPGSDKKMKVVFKYTAN